jgi:hypothetical protein
MSKKDKKKSVETTQETTHPASTTQESAPQTTEGLQLNDLQVMMQIIDVVTQRGAIKADEMSAVGAVYAKLKAFVGQTTQAAPAKTGTEEAPAEVKDDSGNGTD